MSRIYFIEYFLEYRMNSLPAVCCSTKERGGVRSSSVLQCVLQSAAVCCSTKESEERSGSVLHCVLQYAALCVAVRKTERKCGPVPKRESRHVGSGMVLRSVLHMLQCVAVCCSVYYSTNEREETSCQRHGAAACVAVCCSVLQCLLQY